MPKWLKILLGVMAALVLLGGVAVMGAVYWFAKNRAELMASGEKAKAEGQSFAARADADGCVREALRRVGAEGGFMAEVQHRLFLSGCLQVASRGPGFCDGVPSRSAILESVQYAIASCSGYGHAGDQSCARLLQAVQEACEKREPTPN